MRGYRLHEVDGQLQPRLEDLPVPTPGPGQLLIRVRAAGLNRGEFISGHGLHRAGAPAKPAGTEAAGEVMALGDGVQGWALGDRVMGRCPGGFAEQALVDQREALPVPAALDWPAAGALPLTFLVVYDMLVAQGRLQPGESLLVTGISSGVGVAALRAAKALGARVIGTSASAEKLNRLAAEGLDLGLPTRGPDFVEAVRQATGGRGADLVINTVGGSVFAACVQSLGFQGRLAMVGYLDGQLQAPLDLEALHSKRLHLFGVSNKLRTAEQRAQTVAGFRQDWLPWVAQGRLAPRVDRVFPFEQLPQALACMQANGQLGKIVLAGSTDP